MVHARSSKPYLRGSGIVLEDTFDKSNANWQGFVKTNTSGKDATLVGPAAAASPTPLQLVEVCLVLNGVNSRI